MTGEVGGGLVVVLGRGGCGVVATVGRVRAVTMRATTNIRPAIFTARVKRVFSDRMSFQIIRRIAIPVKPLALLRNFT